MSQPVDSVIHDIGYQTYTGPRLGRSYAVRSLYVHSLRAVFGLGRGAKAKIFPWLVIGIVTAVALIYIVLRSVADINPGYRQFVTSMAYPVMLFLAVAAPELVSRDLKDRVLPLYFSRPLHRTDYAWTKLAALVTAIVGLLGAPELLIYVGAVFVRNDGLSGALSELSDLLPGLAMVALYALVLSGLSLLVASSTGRRAFAAAGVIAVFLLSTPLVAVIAVIGRDGPGRELAFLVNPMTATNGVGTWLFSAQSTGDQLPIGSYGPLYGAAVLLLIVVCTAALVWRYRKVPA